MRRLLVVCVAAAGLLFVNAQHVSAVVCAGETITWDGGAGTTAWATATNWTDNRLPTASDRVCIPSGFTVVHSTGTTSILGVDSAGTLTLSGGTLSITDITAASHAETVNLNAGGTIGGTGTFEVAGTLNWTGGTMSGSGTTSVLSGGLLNINNNDVALGAGRTLSNAGATTWSNGDIMASGGSVFANSGTLDVKTDNSGGESSSTVGARRLSLSRHRLQPRQLHRQVRARWDRPSRDGRAARVRCRKDAASTSARPDRIAR